MKTDGNGQRGREMEERWKRVMDRGEEESDG